MITFRLDRFFDAYGDGKSSRKLFSRKFYKTNKTKDEIVKLISKKNTNAGYYKEIALVFPSKQYKLSKCIDIDNNEYAI
jgi:hypothetical protein